MFFQQFIKGFNLFDPDQVVQILAGIGKMFANVGIDFDTPCLANSAIHHRF